MPTGSTWLESFACHLAQELVRKCRPSNSDDGEPFLVVEAGWAVSGDVVRRQQQQGTAKPTHGSECPAIRLVAARWQCHHGI